MGCKRNIVVIFLFLPLRGAIVYMMNVGKILSFLNPELWYCFLKPKFQQWVFQTSI